MYIIKDWANNHLFIDKEFNSFEDGWLYIYENIDNSKYNKTGNENDNEYQEYYVVPKQ